MRKVVLFGALVCLGFPVTSAHAAASVCRPLFDTSIIIEEIEVDRYGSRSQQKAISEAELNDLMTNAFNREARYVTHENKVALSDGQKVTIEATLPTTKKVYQREFDLQSTKGFFEKTAGQYWVMNRNQGRLVIWNYSKDRVVDIELPKNTELMNVVFDLNSDIFRPAVILQYRDISPKTPNVEIFEIKKSLINGEDL